MIALDELLIKIGIDGSQAQQINTYVNMLQNGADNIGANAAAINSKIDNLLNDVSGSLENASEAANKASNDLEESGVSAEKAESKFSKLKIAMVALVGGAMLFGGRIASAFNSAISNAEALFQSKNALYSISKDEIAQVGQYKQSLDKTSLSIDSIKTKIAINLIPTVMAISEKFNGWLVANKDLITNGISKVIEWLGKGIQVVTNFIKFIDKIISSTIGWKNAFIALGVAWAILNRAFLFSPVGLVIAAFGALLLLIDDLMVYMEGGQSLFGSYWDPLISGAKFVIDWFNSLSETVQKVIGIGGAITLAAIAFGGTTLKVAGVFIKAFKMMGAAVRAMSAIMMSNPILLIIAAIATAAYLIYDNWDWLSTQFKKIWSNISGFATNAWNTIISTVSNAIKEVLMYFGMSEDGADSAVKAIGSYFGFIFDLISLPFKTSYEFVAALFGIWTDDNANFIDKIGGSFGVLFDHITTPFKTAMSWISDKFNGFLDATLGKVQGVLNFFGMDVDLVGGNGGSGSPPEDFARYFDSGVSSPNVPSPNSTENKVTNNSMDAKTTINVYANDSKGGANKMADLYKKNLESANDNLKYGMGG